MRQVRERVTQKLFCSQILPSGRRAAERCCRRYSPVCSTPSCRRCPRSESPGRGCAAASSWDQTPPRPAAPATPARTGDTRSRSGILSETSPVGQRIHDFRTGTTDCVHFDIRKCAGLYIREDMVVVFFAETRTPVWEDAPRFGQ